MQTQKPNQKDDFRKQSNKEVSGQSKNLNSKDESGLKRDEREDSNVNKTSLPKTPSKSSPSPKDR